MSDWDAALQPKKKTETERMHEWLREQYLQALELLQGALIEIEIEPECGQQIARDTLKAFSKRHPEVVEKLARRARDRRDACNHTTA